MENYLRELLKIKREKIHEELESQKGKAEAESEKKEIKKHYSDWFFVDKHRRNQNKSLDRGIFEGPWF